MAQRWISVLWGLPIGTAGLIIIIAQSLRKLSGVEVFIKR